MCVPPREQDHDILALTGNRLSKYTYKYFGDGVLHSYQLATFLMLLQCFSYCEISSSVSLRYDLETNHVVIEDISPELLAVLGITREDSDTFIVLPTNEGIIDRLNNAISGLTLGDFRGLVLLCFKEEATLSILNFVCGCHHWDAYAMYHILINRKPYLLSKEILDNNAIDPLCYLPDVPDVFDAIEDYLVIYHKVQRYVNLFNDQIPKLPIKVPQLSGIITEEMWDLSDTIAQSSGVSRYRAANKLRSGYLNLKDLAVGLDFVKNSFYDFGICI